MVCVKDEMSSEMDACGAIDHACDARHVFLHRFSTANKYTFDPFTMADAHRKQDQAMPSLGFPRFCRSIHERLRSNQLQGDIIAGVD
jgi:hypothetical protein